jgi:hypothetical protein
MNAVGIELDIHASAVSAVCRGVIKSCYGYLWKFNSENNGANLDYDIVKKLTTIDNDAYKKTIDQFDKKTGKFIRQWSSSGDIQRALNYSTSNIIASCKGKYQTFYGYIWKYGGKDIIPMDLSKEEVKKALLKGKEIKIKQFDLLGNFIKQWDSMAEINRELGYAQSNIFLCCQGKLKKSHNFIWEYGE